MSQENYDEYGLIKATYHGNTPDVCHHIIKSYLDFSGFGDLIAEHPTADCNSSPDSNVSLSGKKYEAMGCFKDWWNEYISDEEGVFVDGWNSAAIIPGDDFPKTQEAADAIYRKLDFEMCDEIIFRDGEATYQEAFAAFNVGLIKAIKIFNKTGFRPPDGDVFIDGKLPPPMKPKHWDLKVNIRGMEEEEE